MSVRAVRVGGVTYSAAGDSKRSLGRQLVELLPEKLAHLLAHLICVDTMDEVLRLPLQTHRNGCRRPRHLS